MIDSKEGLGKCPKIVDSPNIIWTSLTNYLEITSLLISIGNRDGHHQNMSYCRISAFYPYALELPLKYTIPASYATKHKPHF
jgi:hypothetical protein